MKKLFLTFFLILGLSGTSNAADEGQFRFGADLGFSPVDLEAEKTAQELANLSGSTVTVEYDTGFILGRLYAEYGISSGLDLEFDSLELLHLAQRIILITKQKRLD